MLLEKLKENKGTVSSKLGKELALEVLSGNLAILDEAIELVSFEIKQIKAKNIRAGAAKIIEKVAEKSPELVASKLNQLFSAFEAEEPQTRWMLMMIFGYCASLNPKDSEKAISFARDFIREQNGVCLSGAAELYLGKIGSQSMEYTSKVYPILLEAYDNSKPNEIDWIFEAFIDISPNLSMNQKQEVLSCAQDYNLASKKSTQKRIEKLTELVKEI